MKVAGLLLALFAAYVIGRAVGILTGIGPYVAEAVAIAALLIAVAARRRRAL